MSSLNYKNIGYLKKLGLKLKCSFSSSQIKYSKGFNEIPGPLSLPIIGTLYQYIPLLGSYKFDQLHRNGFKKLERYGPVVREEIAPGQNIVWLFKPEDIETMFRSEGQYPERRSHLILEKYRLDKPTHYNTGGLLPTNGSEWLRMRTFFQRALSSPHAAQQFLPILNEVIDDWLINLEELRTRKTEIDYLPELARLFLECKPIGLILFDIRLNSFTKEEHAVHSRSSKLIEAAETVNSCVLKGDNGFGLWKKFETPLYKKFRKSQEYMEGVAVDLLMLKKNTYSSNTASKLSSLLETYLKVPELDFKDLIGFSCDLLLAGIDTTSYTTSFMLYELGQNSEVQDRLFEESERLLQTPTEHVSVEILKNASYTKAVLKEVLRMHPVSVGIGRTLTEDATFSGYSVPKGTTVVSQNQISCRLKENFNEPDKFIPERWIKGHKMFKQCHPYLLLPFGHGPRACIARRLAEQNMQAFILRLIRQYKLSWIGDHVLDCRSLLINKPYGPVLLKIEKRKT